MGRESRSFSRRLTKVACGGAGFGFLYNYWAGMHWHTTPPSSSSTATVPSTRKQLWQHLSSSTNGDRRAAIYDVCVIGGGLTGLYAAVDAAQRGLSVVLVEAGDFGGSHSSSLLGFLPGPFASCQRAWKQRDTSFMADAVDALRDIRTWNNVAPGCVHRVHTIIPGAHRTESMELRIAAWTASVLSVLAGGSWFTGHRLSSREIDAIVPIDARSGALSRLLSLGVKVEDAVLDVPRVIEGLGRTARTLGVHAVNYTAAVDIVEDANAEGEAYCVTLEDLAPSNENAAPRCATVQARTIINCTGQAVDSIRQYDTWLSTEMAAKEAASDSTSLDGAALATSTTTKLIESCLSYVFFVLPRDGLIVSSSTAKDSPKSAQTTSAAEVSATAMKPVFPSEQAGPNGEHAVLPALVSNSTLRQFSSITVLPYGTDGLLIGGAAPVHHRTGAPSYVRQGSQRSHVDMIDGVHGECLSLSQRQIMRRAVESLAAPLGLSIPGIASCMPVHFPLLARPSRLGNDTATHIEYKGYGVLAGGTDGRGSMVHVLGGTAANCRRTAAAAVDVADRYLASLPSPAPSARRQSRTEHLQIVMLNDDGRQPLSHEGAIQQMVHDGFAVTVEDIIARRTQAAWSDPGRTRIAVPQIAALMAKELQWSDETTVRMVQHAYAFLDRIVV